MFQTIRSNIERTECANSFSKKKKSVCVFTNEMTYACIINSIEFIREHDAVFPKCRTEDKFRNSLSLPCYSSLADAFIISE